MLLSRLELHSWISHGIRPQLIGTKCANRIARVRIQQLQPGGRCEGFRWRHAEFIIGKS
jgi:hypothetical protein